MRGMLDIKVGPNDEIILAGRFDASQAERAEQFLAGVTGTRVVDLGELQYISSLGLGVLLATQKRLMDQGHGLKLVNVRGHVRDILHFAGFDRVFALDSPPSA